MGSFVIHEGDCRDVLKTLASESIDSCITDPPYELGFMGKKWDGTGIANSVEVWGEVLRALKPGAHLLAFGGTRTYHRMVCAIEDAGFEIRDQIGWLYGSGFPKSHNLKGEHEGWGTALKPAWEPIVMARKALIGTVVENVQEHGTGAINIDECRVGLSKGDDPRLGGNGDWSSDKMAKNVYKGGWPGARVTSSVLGRWPANIIHDGSEEVMAEFAKAGEKSSNSGKPFTRNTDKTRSVFGKFEGNREENGFYGDSGSAARFFYCAKASQSDRNEGLNGFEAKVKDDKYRQPTGNAMVDRIHGCGVKRANHHPTVKPTALMRYLCRLVTPPGGIVLDCFAGSGSTGRGALLEGFRFIGIEQEAEYIAIAKARIEAALTSVDFNESPELFAHVG